MPDTKTKNSVNKATPAAEVPAPKGPRVGQLVSHTRHDDYEAAEVTQVGIVVATSEDGAHVAWLPSDHAVLPADQLKVL